MRVIRAEMAAMAAYLLRSARTEVLAISHLICAASALSVLADGASTLRDNAARTHGFGARKEDLVAR